MSKALFHYTPVFSAVMILRDGVIRRSSGKAPPHVWLSSNPTNEPTANRAIPAEAVPPIRRPYAWRVQTGAFRVP